jgi:hypothetical protein
VGTIPQATIVTTFHDPFDGTLDDQPNYVNEPTIISGVLVDGSSLIFSGIQNYDADNDQRKGHYRRPKALGTPGSGVWHTVGVDTLQGNIAGYMSPYGEGLALTGNCCISIISRTSRGPSAWTFNPSATTDTPATPLVYYPDAHRTLGEWEGSNEYYGANTTVRGVTVIDDKLVFAGSNGTGEYCYGKRTTNPEEHLQPDPGAPPDGHFCYDLNNGYKGPHTWPYRYQLWIYNLSALGTGNPWDHIPTIQVLTLPYTPTTALLHIGGIHFDSATRKLYVLQQSGEITGCCTVKPVMHVYHVQAQ